MKCLPATQPPPYHTALCRACAINADDFSSVTQPPPDMAKQPEYSWGSYLMPWEIAWNGQRWVEEHLTMQDVREGFR